jgi:hypothetical protein
MAAVGHIPVLLPPAQIFRAFSTGANKMKQMTLDELRKTKEFRRLDPKPAMFCATYVQSILDDYPDPILATLSAYQVSSRENARIYSYQVLANKKVQAVIALFLKSGKTKRQMHLEEINRQLAAAIVGSKAAQELLTLKIKVEGKKR